MTPGGQSAYVLFDADFTQGGKTVQHRTLAWVYMFAKLDLTWEIYYSSATSPAASFEKNLPVMLDVWQSWKVDDKVFAERMREALSSMKECSRIVREIDANRQRVMARACDDWSECIRGTRIVHDDKYVEYRTESTYVLDEVVRGLNRHEGYERFHVIPLKDLNNP
jgi:hypothetical protein